MGFYRFDEDDYEEEIEEGSADGAEAGARGSRSSRPGPAARLRRRPPRLLSQSGPTVLLCAGDPQAFFQAYTRFLQVRPLRGYLRSKQHPVPDSAAPHPHLCQQRQQHCIACACSWDTLLRCRWRPLGAQRRTWRRLWPGASASCAGWCAPATATPRLRPGRRCAAVLRWLGACWPRDPTRSAALVVPAAATLRQNGALPPCAALRAGGGRERWRPPAVVLGRGAPGGAWVASPSSGMAPPASSSEAQRTSLPLPLLRPAAPGLAPGCRAVQPLGRRRRGRLWLRQQPAAAGEGDPGARPEAVGAAAGGPACQHQGGEPRGAARGAGGRLTALGADGTRRWSTCTIALQWLLVSA